VQHPNPTPARCYKFGQAIGRAIESWDSDLKVVVLGPAACPPVRRERAGFINKKFDLMCMDKIVNEPETLARLSTRELVREAGAQGSEFILWLAMRGALRASDEGT